MKGIESPTGNVKDGPSKPAVPSTPFASTPALSLRPFPLYAPGMHLLFCVWRIRGNYMRRIGRIGGGGIGTEAIGFVSLNSRVLIAEYCIRVVKKRRRDTWVGLRMSAASFGGGGGGEESVVWGRVYTSDRA